ncbi:Major facilitator superfamily MFS_1 [Pararhodospirillum photometricum DSM 122]|uniref:Major facilitator superfamily MFS_1 n=1 Tax=Pararhodospirillum photometricum DSM 122 TaxID=1150469 RepID=H6SQJ1_PARPM|nr:Major facilitator superfamily MFS_1 [Pararhodospirillum photometricum DSM 122]
MLLVALGVSVSLIQALFWREPRHARACLPRLSWRLWVPPGGLRWGILLAVSGLGIGVAWALVTPMLVDAGWSLERIGLVMNVLGPLVGVGTAAGTGVLLRLWGRRRLLAMVSAGQGLLLLALLVATTPGFVEAGLVAALLLMFVVYGAQMTVLYTLMMDHADPDAPGAGLTSQYALYYLFTTLWGWGGLQLAESLGVATTTVVGLMLALGFAGALPFLLAARSSPLITETLE